MSSSASNAADGALVTLHEVEKRYGSRTVLRIDRFELCRGDSLLVTGANGSGKSTMMRLLSGISVASSGRVRQTPAYRAMKVCHVPQAGGLHPGLSLADNLRAWQRLVGSEGPADLAAQWYIRGLDLEPFMQTRCGELSGGFQRLAALACALATDPDGLFIDEPLSGIDTSHANALLQGLAAERSRLQFLVATGHAPDEFTPATRVLDLSAGVLA